ncbi:hypothetical protein K502DRAFT_323559 [Neoconidiobolus thromboides FSU 785]|nr:hypothetical protein K502DRAFT_323559 [Neoconidiobolus thromboides FSU 785]
MNSKRIYYYVQSPLYKSVAQKLIKREFHILNNPQRNLINKSYLNIKETNLDDPSISDKLPDRPVSNPGEEDNLPPPPEKTTDVILFPWLYGNQKHRFNNMNYILSPMFNRLPIFPARFYLWLSRMLSQWILKLYAIDSRYFEQEFIMGAQLAFERLCQSLSLGDQEGLKSMMDEDLYKFYSKELEKVKKEKGSVAINALNIHNTYINDVFITLGPKEGYSIHNENYFNLFLFTCRIIVNKKIAFNKETDNSNRNEILEELKKGTQFKLYVECDADVNYKLSDATTIIVDDTSRRKFILTFDSDYFNFSKVSKITEDEWNWKLSDIDQVLEYKNRDSFLKWFKNHYSIDKIYDKNQE